MIPHSPRPICYLLSSFIWISTAASALATPACCLHGHQSNPVHHSQSRSFLCSELSRLSIVCRTLRYLSLSSDFSLTGLISSCFSFPLFTAPTSAGFSLFLKSQACPCPRIFAQAISFLCSSNLSPNLHLVFSLASLGSFQMYLVSKIFSDHPKVITPFQPLGLPIPLSCLICSP